MIILITAVEGELVMKYYYLIIKRNTDNLQENADLQFLPSDFYAVLQYYRQEETIFFSNARQWLGYPYQTDS